MNLLTAPLPAVRIGRWPGDLLDRLATRSQEQARRNAMAACTVLTARRVERVEVEEFVAAYLDRRAAAAAADVDPAAGHHAVDQVG